MPNTTHADLSGLFWCDERGLFRVIVIDRTRRERDPRDRRCKRIFMREYYGSTPGILIRAARRDGFLLPTNAGELCSSAPCSQWNERRAERRERGDA